MINEESNKKFTFLKKVSRFFGIEIYPDRWARVRFRFRFFVFAFIFVIFVSLGGATVYSTHPSFCRSCHIMEPYYKAWENSKHKGIATCVDCHYPPGSHRTILWKKFQAVSQVAKFITQTYSSKPFAEIDDASCLRSGCHSTRLLQGKIVSAKGIMFDHKPHLEGVRYGRQLRCVSCHSQIVVGKHIEVTWDSCYLCHLKGRKQGRHIEVLGGCLGCHQLSSRQIKVRNITYNHRDFLNQHNVSCENCHQDIIAGEGEVSQERCTRCHNQPEKLARFNEISFLHANHVTKHNTACLHCHKEIVHRVTQAGTKQLSLECSSCHFNTHDTQRNIYMGSGAKGISPMPSPMYLANVDCVGCHVEKKGNSDGISNAETFLGSEKGCTNCHGNEYTGIVADIHTVIHETGKKVASKLASLKKHFADNLTKGAMTADIAQHLMDAEYNMAFIARAHTLHNIYYAAQILRQIDETLSMIASNSKIELEDISQDPIISGGFCATLCHTKVNVKVPPDQISHYNKIMPHREHFEKHEVMCTQCHLFGTHKDVKLKTPATCFIDCHDKKEKNCNGCHKDS